jgi:hypothetical protein
LPNAIFLFWTKNYFANINEMNGWMDVFLVPTSPQAPYPNPHSHLFRSHALWSCQIYLLQRQVIFFSFCFLIVCIYIIFLHLQVSREAGMEYAQEECPMSTDGRRNWIWRKNSKLNSRGFGGLGRRDGAQMTEWLPVMFGVVFLAIGAF